MGIASLVLIFPDEVTVWTDPSAASWPQTAYGAVGVLAVSVVVLALLTASMAQASRKVQPDPGPPAAFRSKLITATAVGALGGTFLGFLAYAAAQDHEVHATSVVADTTTVGALLGLAFCVPAALAHAQRHAALLRDHDHRSYGHLWVVRGFVVAMATVSLGTLLT